METVKGFISIFMSAISNCMLYSSDHTSVDELARKAFSILDAFLKESDHFEIMIVEDDLIINKNPARGVGVQGNNLIRRLKRKGISRVDLVKGITLSELKRFIADLSTSEQGTKSYPHVRSGVVDLHVNEFPVNRNFHPGSETHFTAEQVEKLREEYSRISPFKRLQMAGFDDIVNNFIMMFKKEASILKILKPAKSSHEYAYTHATNVSVLSMFQAQTLGIREDLVHDIGIAGLLHDIGKSLVPGDSRGTKDAHAAGKEAEELHPIYGAQYLAKINGLTRLAPIVAFEHHLRYDGKGYPQLSDKNSKQHICSQMVAIADYFEIVRNQGSHGKALEIGEVLSLMRATEEGVFNPYLIDNFVRSMHMALSG